jgi:hypothetical protein
VWDELGACLSGGARAIVLGRPALCDPPSGVVLAIALGTAYALRIAAGDLDAALAAGLRPTYAYNAPAKTLDATI